LSHVALSADAEIFSTDQFLCASGESIPKAQVNDDFCDCESGDDEPGTSACADGAFWCKNKGFVGKFIHSAAVGDSVCDCCDGSDESSGSCPDTCQADGAQMRKQRRIDLASVQAGLQLKVKLTQEIMNSRSTDRARVEELKSKLETLKASTLTLTLTLTLTRTLHPNTLTP